MFIFGKCNPPIFALIWNGLSKSWWSKKIIYYIGEIPFSKQPEEPFVRPMSTSTCFILLYSSFLCLADKKMSVRSWSKAHVPIAINLFFVSVSFFFLSDLIYRLFRTLSCSSYVHQYFSKAFKLGDYSYTFFIMSIQLSLSFFQLKN